MPVTARSDVGVNWSRTYAYEAPGLLRPATVEELQAVVAGSARMRVLGTRHAFNDMADSVGPLVSLDRLPRHVEVDTAAGTARVSGHLRYGDVAGELDAAGLALPNLASLPHISVAGACATGTHGSGVTSGNLATSVVAMELVRADGELVTLREGEADFAGAVVHLGALGVVTSLTLRLVPAFQVSQQVFRGLRWVDTVEHLDDVLGAEYSVSLFTDLRDGTFDAWLKRAGGTRTDDLLGVSAATEQVHPVPGGAGADCTVQRGVPGPWYARLPHFRLEFTPSNGEEIQSEYFVPRARGREALGTLTELAPVLAPLAQVCEVRTVAADDLWLSPAHRTDSLALHFTWHDRPEELATVLPVLEDALVPYGARPHWGKIFTMTAAQIAAAYPRLADFRALVGRMDPDGVFGNDYLARTVLAASS
jgi:xylitol oxidase